MIEIIQNTGVGPCMLLEEFPEINYTLLRRDTKFEPYIAAWCLNKENGHWGQGHYFQNLDDAVEYIWSIKADKGVA